MFLITKSSFYLVRTIECYCHAQSLLHMCAILPSRRDCAN